jgi:hypothetical protein
MRDANHVNGQDVVMDRVQNTAPILSQPVSFPTGQLLGVRWARIPGQASNPIDNPATVRCGSNGFEFLPRGSLDTDAITCHAASDL